MERYKDPNWLKEPSDVFWEDSEISKWCDSAQYTVISIIKELQIGNYSQPGKERDNYWNAYYLGKNLWYNGATEEEIRKELAGYATTVIR